jgi:hypothetical protein
MAHSDLRRIFLLIVAAVILSLLVPHQALAFPDQQPRGGRGGGDGGKKKPQGKEKPTAEKKSEDDEDNKPAKSKKNEERIRWGQRRNESDEKYDKRFASLLKKIKQDKKGDYTGGMIVDAHGREARLWTYMGHPFIVRTDIDATFTADTAMYMEMLHREYSAAYQILLGEAADVKEKIEVIIYADQGTYTANGGMAGSGGFFTPMALAAGDRSKSWPARHFRLVQFTDGVTDFAHWPKGTLKHESAHMELQLRLGFTLKGGGIGYPVRPPLWFNEGQATNFEYWDFDKTVEENFAEIPKRGRYAPFIRRIHETPKWQEFDYVWDIDPGTWQRDMTREQGFLNYAQAWSLVAYMMNGGKSGRRDFRTVFDLSKRVGTDEQTTMSGDRKKAWTDKFPEKQRQLLEKDWNEWVTNNLPRDERVPDEEWYLKLQGYRADIIDRLEHIPAEEWKTLQDKVEREEQQRRKEIKIEK